MESIVTNLRKFTETAEKIRHSIIDADTDTLSFIPKLRDSGSSDDTGLRAVVDEGVRAVVILALQIDPFVRVARRLRERLENATKPPVKADVDERKDVIVECLDASVEEDSSGGASENEDDAFEMDGNDSESSYPESSNPGSPEKVEKELNAEPVDQIPPFRHPPIENPYDYYISPSMNDNEGRDATKRCFGERRSCPKCGQTYISRGLFSVHERICGTIYVEACLYCPEVFTASERTKNFFKHKQTHAQYFPSGCPFCASKFSDLYKLRRHLVQKHENYVGHKSGKVCQMFPSLPVSKAPERVCPECKKTFSCLTAFHVHMQIHPNVCSIKCPECPKKFFAEKIMRMHLKEMHVDAFKFTCIVCNKIFKTKVGLYRHCIKTHKPTIPVECPVCKKSFSSVFNLKYHQELTHLEKGKRICPVCGKVMKRLDTFRMHMILHSSDPKPFICEMCGKAFSHPTGLSQHIRIHTKLKPFKCAVCNRAFSQRSGLAAHKKKCGVSKAK